MSKPKTQQVKCPKCGRKQDYTGPDALYYCKHCRAYHDDDPDEGGDFSNNPTRRIERHEEREEARHARQNRRR